MAVKLTDVIAMIESIAPPVLAEEWDNSGLQIGCGNWPVEKLWVALDALPEIVTAACEQQVNLLVTHHPLFFDPLKQIDFESPVGSIIQQTAQHRLAIYAAHTNLDSVSGGVNDLLARRLGLIHIRPLNAVNRPAQLKLVFFIPPDHEKQILKTLFDTGAGQIGAYSCCSFRSFGKGTFKPGAGTDPFAGEVGVVSDVDEIRIETVIDAGHADTVVEQIRQVHPYETMAYDLYPLSHSGGSEGLGRIGEPSGRMSLASLAGMVKRRLGIESVKVAGKPDLSVEKIALCSGSGSGLMQAFLSSDADVYISGDLHYHDARTAESLGRGLIDVGHFISEVIIVDDLSDRLKQVFHSRNTDIRVEPSRMEADPFYFL